MILSTFSELKFYHSLNPHFASVSDWLAATDLKALAAGKTIIDGENVFALKSCMPGRSAAEAPLEAHRKYIDVQICTSGLDNIAWRELSECKSISSEYHAENDIMFFSDEATHTIKIYDDKLAIFFPQDAHAPLIGSGELEKIVIKVACV